MGIAAHPPLPSNKDTVIQIEFFYLHLHVTHGKVTLSVVGRVEFVDVNYIKFFWAP